MPLPTPKLIDNPSVQGREAGFVILEVDLKKIISSWQRSLFSFEWLTPQGTLKPVKDLKSTDAEKFQAVQEALKKGQPIERPVLGIGILDSIEIGSGKAVLLTLYALGLKRLSVHVPNSSTKDFRSFQ